MPDTDACRHRKGRTAEYSAINLALPHYLIQYCIYLTYIGTIWGQPTASSPDRMVRNLPWKSRLPRSEKLGRGGTDDELAKPLIVIQRVQIPPDQSRADRQYRDLPFTG